GIRDFHVTGVQTCALPISPIDTEFNIRVATAPTRLGERVTMRLLGQEAQSLTLPTLGMSDQDMQHFRQAIRKPFGMILLTGPTEIGRASGRDRQSRPAGTQ